MPLQNLYEPVSQPQRALKRRFTESVPHLHPLSDPHLPQRDRGMVPDDLRFHAAKVDSGFSEESIYSEDNDSQTTACSDPRVPIVCKQVEEIQNELSVFGNRIDALHERIYALIEDEFKSQVAWRDQHSLGGLHTAPNEETTSLERFKQAVPDARSDCQNSSTTTQDPHQWPTEMDRQEPVPSKLAKLLDSTMKPGKPSIPCRLMRALKRSNTTSTRRDASTTYATPSNSKDQRPQPVSPSIKRAGTPPPTGVYDEFWAKHDIRGHHGPVTNYSAGMRIRPRMVPERSSSIGKAQPTISGRTAGHYLPYDQSPDRMTWQLT